MQGLGEHQGGISVLSNPDVSEREILDGHFQATASRVAAVKGPVLVLQDPTEFSFRRNRPETIGAIGYSPSRRGEDGRVRLHTVHGLLMHGSLAITPEGPLGLAATRFWSRAKFKGTAALKRHVNPTRVPIEAKESMRWPANMQAATTRHCSATQTGSSISVIARMTSTSSSAPRRRPAPTSLCGPASIGCR